MDVIYKGRMCGKTYDLIHKSSQNGIPIMCYTHQQCSQVENMANKIGVNIRTISFHKVVNGFYIGSVMIDNIEDILKAIIPVKVDTITATDYSYGASPITYNPTQKTIQTDTLLNQFIQDHNLKEEDILTILKWYLNK